MHAAKAAATALQLLYDAYAEADHPLNPVELQETLHRVEIMVAMVLGEKVEGYEPWPGVPTDAG